MQDETGAKKDTSCPHVSVSPRGSSCWMKEEAVNPVEYEVVQIEKTKKVCPLCENYAKP